MAVEAKAGSKDYRTRLRARLAGLGFEEHHLAERVFDDLVSNCGKRVRQAWRLAWELSLDEVAARYNAISDDPRAPMRKARIWDWEQWPDRGVRPTIPALKILATLYSTTWDRLLDIHDLEAMPPADLREYHARHSGGRLIPAPRTPLTHPTSLTIGLFAAKWHDGRPTQRDVIMAAAKRSRDFGRRAEQTNLGSHTLEQLHADVRRIVAVYPHQPVFPTFLEVVESRDAAFELIEGRQHPAQTRDLYLITGTLCGILANASFDLGYLDAAATQARTAHLCAELAGSNWLKAWIRGMQSLIAYWDDRFADAAALASSAADLVVESGTAAVRLACVEARAHARLGDAAAAQDALRRARAVRENIAVDDEFAGMLAFPEEKQLFYTATCNVWLPGRVRLRQAERAATDAIRLYEQAEPHQRRTGELLLARLDLASAHLGLDDPHAAAGEIRTVMASGALRRTDSVKRRLQQLDQLVSTARFADTAIARELSAEITEYCTVETAPALPEGAG